jgi:4-oxalmesaconate hydratase
MSASVIDCHGHYTTSPPELAVFRKAQVDALSDPRASRSKAPLHITDDQIRESVEGAQLRLQCERGTDLTLFSPRAAGMGHHVGDETTSRHWSEHCNDLIHRVCTLFPDRFVGVCQLPQSPGAAPAGSIGELRRCVTGMGFVGCNLNPDPSGGHWSGPPITDRSWYPLYEAMVELDVPAMLHTSHSCNPGFHTAGAHFINGDTTVFMQLVEGHLFRDFPTLRFVIPHGGGAVPYQWGRYRGLAQDMGKSLREHLLGNVFFDTCVYDRRGMKLLLEAIPADNILFASEIFGAVQSVDPETGYAFDDTKRLIDGIETLAAADRQKIMNGNARRVYPRLVQRRLS